MTMILPRDAFEVTAWRLTEQAGRHRSWAKGRLSAAVIVLVLHIVLVVAIVTGIQNTQIVRQSAAITVHIDPENKKPEILPPPAAPFVARPILVTVPVPQFTVIAQPTAISAVPLTTPSPPHPAAVTPSPNPLSNAVPTWQQSLLARLEQAKRYPEMARLHRQEGVVLLHFTMDRDGHVLSADVRKSSGYDALDREALALIQHAQPLPNPPPEVAGNPIELVVPIEFYLNDRRF